MMQAVDFFLNTRAGNVLFYAVIMAVTAGLSFSSGENCQRKLISWQFFSWVGANLAFTVFGPHEALWLTTAWNVVIVINIAALARKHQCRTSWEVARLYCLQFAIVALAAYLHDPGSALFFGALNVVFMARMLVTGGPGAMALVGKARDRSDSVIHWPPRYA